MIKKSITGSVYYKRTTLIVSSLNCLILSIQILSQVFFIIDSFASLCPLHQGRICWCCYPETFFMLNQTVWVNSYCLSLAPFLRRTKISPQNIMADHENICHTSTNVNPKQSNFYNSWKDMSVCVCVICMWGYMYVCKYICTHAHVHM